MIKVTDIADRYCPQYQKISGNMDTAERLLKLLGMLQSRADWTGNDLAERLQVTPRTVRRDIGRLRDLGYPVEAFSGPGGGYRLGSGGKLPPLILDDDEALAVALGLRLSVTGSVGGLEDASLSAMSKLETVLPGRLRSRLEDVSTATISMSAPSRSSVKHGSLATVAETIRKRQRLRFTYTDGNDRISERHTEPFRLVHTGRRWYLVAFDLDRDDWRTFRMDRVEDPRSTLLASASREQPDALEFVQRGVAIDVWSHRASIILNAPAAEASTLIHPAVGTIEPLADAQRCRLTIGADDLDWLARFLINLPVAFDVEEPAALRDELVRIGSDLTARFS